MLRAVSFQSLGTAYLVMSILHTGENFTFSPVLFFMQLFHLRVCFWANNFPFLGFFE